MSRSAKAEILQVRLSIYVSGLEAAFLDVAVAAGQARAVFQRSSWHWARIWRTRYPRGQRRRQLLKLQRIRSWKKEEVKNMGEEQKQGEQPQVQQPSQPQPQQGGQAQPSQPSQGGQPAQQQQGGQ